MKQVLYEIAIDYITKNSHSFCVYAELYLRLIYKNREDIIK